MSIICQLGVPLQIVLNPGQVEGVATPGGLLVTRAEEERKWLREHKGLNCPIKRTGMDHRS